MDDDLKKDLIKLRNQNKDKVIVFCSGTFDLLHAGHILFFEDCKKQGDFLVVGVGRDEFIKYYKGPTLPIINESMRVKMINSLKIVDYVLLEDWPGKQEEGLFSTIFPIMELLKPDKWVINTDAFDIPKRKDIAKRLGIELVILNRNSPKEFEEVSTSKIIAKIKNLK